MKICAVIMAGGKEMRFGPVKNYVGSKKFLQIGGREEILIETIFRCDTIFNNKRDDIYIVTNEEQKSIIEKVLESKKEVETNNNYDFPPDNYIIEQEPKGTAYCILLAALFLKKKYNDQSIIMCIFPSDHDIEDKKLFKKTLEKAITIASKEKKLITIGIAPRFPARAYGYIRYDNAKNNNSYYNVKYFIEKPRIKKTRLNIDKEKYFWNSGIFVWNLDLILNQYEILLNESYEKFRNLNNYTDPGNAIREWKKLYRSLEPKFVDKAIIEKTDRENILVVKGNFDWQDIGKWDALLAVFSDENNIIDINIIGIDITNQTIFSSGKFIYREDRKFTFNFSDNSYVWLYCDDKQKQEVIEILKNIDQYKKTNFKSIEIDSLINKIVNIKEDVNNELKSVCDFSKDIVENSDLVKEIEKFISTKLRNVIFNKPEREKEIQNAIESLLIGKGMNKGIDYDRETGKFLFSGREYIPDFIIPKLNLCIEVKLLKDATHKSKLIEEINADITAYTKNYERLLFIVYDLGFIRDETEFKRDIENSGEVKLVIVKH